METENYSFEKIIFKKRTDGVCTKFQIKNLNFKPIKFIIKHLFAIMILFIVFSTWSFKISSVLSITLSLYSYVKLNSTVIKEELFFIPTVGIQELSTDGTGRKTIKIYAQRQIKHLIIAESVNTLRVTFYLCLVFENENQITSLKPLLTGTKPKLDVLKQIYQDTNYYFK